MQPRITSLLCLRRSLALRSSTFNSERLSQQRFFSSTHLRCFHTPFVRVEIRCVARELLQLHPATSRPAGQKVLDRPSPVDRRAVPYDKKLARNLAHEVL